MGLIDLPEDVLRARLDEARLALHRLLTGAAVVEAADGGGRRVQYAAAQIGELRRYVAELEAALAAKGGRGFGGGPIRVAF